MEKGRARQNSFEKIIQSIRWKQIVECVWPVFKEDLEEIRIRLVTWHSMSD
jgi:hypothetical protein